ncbi:MAG TPA: heparinase II/III family protein [Burkholderiaceae bacterium]|nr:heparinase II/III family protein [Burkholderiaceae bacterium]
MNATLAKLSWYRHRLQLMSPAEVLYRLQQSASSRFLGTGPRAVPQPRRQLFGRPWCGDDLPRPDDPHCIATADRLLSGRWDVFGLRDAPLGFPPQWNVDPLTGTRAPMSVGRSIDYRDERQVGNIKYLWEPARHLELTTLAQAWHLSRDDRYLEGCRALLSSWFMQCPYPLGVHWTSALELGIRLVNWAVSWHLLGGADSSLFAGTDGARLRAAWLEQVWRHAEFVAGSLSRYSSANNHLLGETMGLFIAGLTWPCWDESTRWRERGRASFEAEALKQTAQDGVNREQAVWYHHEVADMMLLCGLFGRANGVKFQPAYWHRLEAMVAFIAAITDAGGHVPMFGDADHAVMVRFDTSPGFDPYRSLRATGAALFNRELGPGSHMPDLKTQWLLGNDARAGFKSREMDAPPRGTAFPEGGYWILVDRRGQPEEVRVVADAGPLGYLSLAAHGHADALSFVLSIGGHEVLIDPGTYAYHTERRWRDYFRGTSAHNTLRVDSLDQSTIGGSFMWLQKANARCLAFDDVDGTVRWAAEHDGYRRLADPVLHQRSIVLHQRERRIEVVDALQCRRAHRIELFWHFAEGVEPRLEGADSIIIRFADRRWKLEAPGLELSLHRGEEDPPLGWISRRFDEKLPTWTLRCSRTIEGPTQIRTLFLEQSS